MWLSATAEIFSAKPERFSADQNVFSFCLVHQNKFYREYSFPLTCWEVDSSNWDEDQALQLKLFTPCYHTTHKYPRTGIKSSIYFTFLVILLVNYLLSVKQHLPASHAEQNIWKFQ